MKLEIHEQSAADLATYSEVPIAFVVDRIFDVESRGHEVLTERKLTAPYLKDYDALDGGPARWPERFDLSSWGLLGAFFGDRRVGGAAVALNTPGLTMLEDRPDLGVLWDLRVAREHRRTGVGSALFEAAEAWAKARGCRELRVETQNINVPACRFYARQGCRLGAVHRNAYSALPEEIQLLWHKALGPGFET